VAHLRADPSAYERALRDLLERAAIEPGRVRAAGASPPS
jgi:hypothetical protein